MKCQVNTLTEWVTSVKHWKHLMRIFDIFAFFCFKSLGRYWGNLSSALTRSISSLFYIFGISLFYSKYFSEISRVTWFDTQISSTDQDKENKWLQDGERSLDVTGPAEIIRDYLQSAALPHRSLPADWTVEEERRTAGRSPHHPNVIFLGDVSSPASYLWKRIANSSGWY